MKFQPGHHVGQRGAPRHQALGLKHITGAFVDACEWLAKHRHRASAGGQQPGTDIEQRALAAAGGADHADKFTSADRQAHVLDGGVALLGVVPVGKGAGHTLQLQRRRHVSPWGIWRWLF